MNTKKEVNENHLIIAATQLEVQPLIQNSQCKKKSPSLFVPWQGSHLLITGTGQYATIFQVMQYLRFYGTPENIINVGICGSYRKKLTPETLVQIIRDEAAEQVTETRHKWKKWHEAGLPEAKSYPVIPDAPLWSDKLNLTKANGITTDHITDDPVIIERRREFFQADTESMEGAAVFYAAVQLNINALQIRCISNYTGIREKSQWKLNESISRLNNFIFEKLKPILTT